MNKGFYLKMAWGNIRKNRNIYLPYLLAASVMTALFYIQGSLCDMVDISSMKGKRMMSSQYTDNGYIFSGHSFLCEQFRYETEKKGIWPLQCSWNGKTSSGQTDER